MTEANKLQEQLIIKNMCTTCQTYVSEPSQKGGYQVAKYDILQNLYVPIKGEMYQFEDAARQRAHDLNEFEKDELKLDYEDSVIVISADFDSWGIKDAINTYNELKAKEEFLSSDESQKLLESKKRITAWNKRVNEAGKNYDNLAKRGIRGLTSPFKYAIKGFGSSAND